MSQFRSQQAILGALVADAASMGVHWIYSPQRIADIAPNAPEFLIPQEANYEGVGYYAHGGKQAGQPTHYGEQMLVAMRSMARNDGNWKPYDYIYEFVQTFERGGSWSGYMDHATKGTLDNAAEAQEWIQNKTKELAGHVREELREFAFTQIEKRARTLRGEALVRTALEAAKTQFSDANDLDDIAMVIRYYTQHRKADIGADDKQMPAFTKVVPIVARYAGDANLLPRVEQAIRATNNNDTAVAFSLFGAEALEQVIQGTSIQEAIVYAAEQAGGGVRKKIEEALAFESDEPAIISKHFGAACNTDMAFPTSVAVLKNATSYTHGVRQNIYASGDNAGRAIFVGAMLGAAFAGSTQAMPLSWLSKLENLRTVLTMTEILSPTIT